MAFVNRIGNIVKQARNKHVNLGLSASNSSIYQAIRCMSSSKIFVGGLSYGTDEMTFREAFAQYGEVVEAKIVMDRQTGRSRGFGFISYTSTEEASSAMQAMDGQDLHGRTIRVNFATERPRGVGFGSGGYGAGGGFYSGGGGGSNSYGGAQADNYAGGDVNYSGSNYGTSAVGSYGGGMSSFNDGGSATHGGGSNSANYNPSSDFFNSNSVGEQFDSQVDSGSGGANEDFDQDPVVDKDKAERAS